MLTLTSCPSFRYPVPRHVPTSVTLASTLFQLTATQNHLAQYQTLTWVGSPPIYVLGELVLTDNEFQGPDPALPPPRLCRLSPVTSTNNPVAIFCSNTQPKCTGIWLSSPASQPPRSLPIRVRRARRFVSSALPVGSSAPGAPKLSKSVSSFGSYPLS